MFAATNSIRCGRSNSEGPHALRTDLADKGRLNPPTMYLRVFAEGNGMDVPTRS